MKHFRTRGEWLVGEDNEIAVRTLRFWFEYFDIIPVRFSDKPLGESQFFILVFQKATKRHRCYHRRWLRFE